MECVAITSLEILLNMQSYNPYQCAYFLFYSFRQQVGRLQIYGGVDWRTADQLHGRIRTLNQSRSFLPTYEVPLTPIIATDAAMVVPICFSHHQQQECTLYDIKDRVSWYLSQNKIAPTFNAPACLFMGVIGSIIQDRAQQAIFFKHRAALETQLWGPALERICATESGAANLLDMNFVSFHRREPTNADFYSFFKRFGESELPPTFVLVVPMETTQCDLLPLHSGGEAHLTYKDIPAWMMHQFCVQDRRMLTKRIDPQHADERARRFVTQFLTFKPAREKSHPQNAMPAVHVEASKLTDLVPLCLQNIMKRAQFPKHRERLRIITSFREAGVKAESVFEWFEKMNEQFPHKTTRYATAKARFDYEYAWNSTTLGKTYCANIIKDGSCPFVVQDVEDLIGSCKMACAPNETVPFSGPYNLIRRNIKRKNLVLYFQSNFVGHLL